MRAMNNLTKLSYLNVVGTSVARTGCKALPLLSAIKSRNFNVCVL